MIKCKCKPELIVSDKITNLWSYKGRKLRYNEPDFNDVDETTYYEFVLTSMEHEKIEIGDKCVQDFRLVDITCNRDSCCANLNKVVALQRQIPPEHIETFVDLYNKNGELDYVFVEMENCHVGYKDLKIGVEPIYKKVPKLSGGYVSIVEKDIINYTE